MIIVIGSLTVQQEKLEEAIELSQKHANEARKQLGCISYALHIDTERKNLLVFIERWQHMDDLEKHFQTPSSLDFGKKISELVKSTPTIEIYQSQAMQRH